MKKRICLSTLLLILFTLLIGLAAWFSYQKSRMDSTGHIPDPDTEYLITQYADATGVQGTFYTITNNDTLIIIDGGWAGNADAVRKVIAEHNNTVDAWIISHPHQDHAGAFNVIYSNPGDITIKAIYDNGFDYDFIEAAGEPYDDITVMETFHALTKDAGNVTHLKRGDNIALAGDLTLSVFNAWDDSVISNIGDEKDYQNNASLLFKISGTTNSMLFCSDIKYDMNDYLLSTYRDDISCDYIQTGHHGNWSFSDEFYEAAGAACAFIDAPSSITENPDFPASSLKAFLQKKGTVFDFSTAPNSVTLK